jgi:anti-sigma B factor antagonist
MQIAERDSGRVTVLDLSGKMTLGEGDTLLTDKLRSLLHQGKKNVLLNLAQVNYVDSAGLGAIVSAYTTVTREGGSLKLANVTKRLQDLLSITKLLTVFETFDSEDEGIRSFKS